MPVDTSWATEAGCEIEGVPRSGYLSCLPFCRAAIAAGTTMTSPAPTRNGSTTEEAVLICKIIGGRRDLFGDLITPHLSSLANVVRSTIGSHPEVEDIVQQAALKAFTHLAQFRFEAGFKTWLIRIGLNEARQWRRKYASSRFVEFTPAALSELPIADQSHSPLTEYEKSETCAQLSAALSRLPEKYRNVILLRDLGGVSISETAVRLGVTTPTVKSRLRRARQKVAGFLKRSESISAANRACRASS
jgi:RNA polymerase sigma factor CnrH